jgi:fatty acid desaturase
MVKCSNCSKEIKKKEDFNAVSKFWLSLHYYCKKCFNQLSFFQNRIRILTGQGKNEKLAILVFAAFISMLAVRVIFFTN